ncbi:putative BOI-related E3 ubiquitin-protein ligase 3 [Silene latifolia]|uniref:putative BOI-related E3 ubiquitin-protein ligase 3 n=1 Tax=Silene latifolia TaxID=37657 RepID=UPI003D77990A
MAIQANMYPDNLGLPVSSQDYFFLENNNNNNNNNMSHMNNNNLLYNGCGLNELKFLQQQQLQQQQQQQQQQEYLFRLQNMQKRNIMNNSSFMLSQPSKKQKLATTTVTTASTTTSESDYSNHNHNISMGLGFSRSFYAEVEKQSQEIDRFVTLQNERLRLALQEQRRQQMVTIIKKIEANASKILQQKDEEIVEATKKSMEFQQIVEKLELENQVWQNVALENEAMVVSLNNTLEQLKQQQQQQKQEVEDQEDVCSSSSSNCVVDDEKEETCKFQETKKGNLDLCKMCNSREKCVVILPCRHLCCCSLCDVDNCPVCNSPKRASIQVLIS